MRKLIIAWALMLAGILCFAHPARAQLSMTGAGCASARCGGGGGSYSGPGDVISGASGFFSCSRVYNLASATTSTSMCDLVAVTGGAAVCTLRGSSSGLVDLTAYCPGTTTPPAACAAASGGSCKVTKMYDQTGSGNPITNATLATMPTITFAAQNGLPSVNFLNANSTVLATASQIPGLTQPFTVSWVGKKTATTGFEGMFGFGVSEYFNTANTTYLFDGTSSATVSITEGSNVTVMDLFNSPASAATSAIYVNGTALSTTLAILGASDSTGNPWPVGCGNGCSDFVSANVYEIMIWTGNQSANASALSTEQRNATYGYNF
jgi:hypothetical protein